MLLVSYIVDNDGIHEGKIPQHVYIRYRWKEFYVEDVTLGVIVLLLRSEFVLNFDAHAYELVVQCARILTRTTHPLTHLLPNHNQTHPTYPTFAHTQREKPSHSPSERALSCWGIEF